MDPLSLLWLFFILASLQPAVQRQMMLLHRRRALAVLSRERQGTVITLIHRQESMSLLGFPIVRYIDIDDAESVLRAINETPAGRSIEIVLHTPGGMVIAARQIATALADHDGHVTAVVPHYAMSGGTMIALAADEIVVDAHASLGPVDPQLGQYPAASLVAVCERPGDHDDQTLLMADVGRKAIAQVEGFTERLLGRYMPAGRAAEVARLLATGTWTHDHPLQVHELQALGLPVRVGVPEGERELMTLYPQPRGRQPAVEYAPGPPALPRAPRGAGPGAPHHGRPSLTFRRASAASIVILPAAFDREVRHPPNLWDMARLGWLAAPLATPTTGFRIPLASARERPTSRPGMTMTITPAAIAVRPGEHACFRFERHEERERIADAFMCVGLRLGHRVVYLCDSRDVDATLLRLTAAAPDVASALRSGALEVRDANTTYLDGRAFDVEQMMAALHAEHRRALAEGFAGLSVTGDVVAALVGASPEALVEYERRLDEEFGDATQLILCQFDQHRFETGTLVEMTEAHHVEVSPPLATMDPTGALAAARVHPPETLRLAGDLDFENVAGLLDYLDANVHGPLRVDLADVAFADVAGMRALRGGRHRQLTIADASEPVWRLVGLLGWDTDPGVLVQA